MRKYNDWLDFPEPLFTDEQLRRGLTDEDLKRARDRLVEEFGVKGLTFELCRFKGSTLCQNPQNRKVCMLPSQAPEEFVICGDCRFHFRVVDGLIDLSEEAASR
jgi:hypothetical protein